MDKSVKRQVDDLLIKRDFETLGLASRAMGEAGFYPAIPHLKKISSSTEPVRIYIMGDFLVKPLCGWVEEALSKLI